MHRLQRNRIEHLDHVQLPSTERDPVQRLVREDVLRRDRSWTVDRHRPAQAPEGVPNRAAEPGPGDVQARVDVARVLRDALQVVAQRRAVTLPRGELVLGAAALR